MSTHVVILQETLEAMVTLFCDFMFSAELIPHFQTKSTNDKGTLPTAVSVPPLLMLESIEMKNSNTASLTDTMCSLWANWIVLDRVLFIRNY
jgi:hypothetical protein